MCETIWNFLKSPFCFHHWAAYDCPDRVGEKYQIYTYRFYICDKCGSLRRKYLRSELR